MLGSAGRLTAYDWATTPFKGPCNGGGVVAANLLVWLPLITSPHKMHRISRAPNLLKLVCLLELHKQFFIVPCPYDANGSSVRCVAEVSSKSAAPSRSC